MLFNLQNHPHKLELLIERYKTRWRIVLVNDMKEIACRTETSKKLMEFIDTNNETLFKGSIRLTISGNLIGVQFKTNPVGTITREQLCLAIA